MNTMSPTELRAWRKSTGLTQQTLAEIAGVSLRTVTRWESGEVPIPRLLTWYIAAH